MRQLKNMIGNVLLFNIILAVFIIPSESLSTKSIEDQFYAYEDEKNSMLAFKSQDVMEEFYEDFYDELDNGMVVSHSMNVIFFGPAISFLRLDAETILHILVHTKKHLIPITKTLLAWDIVTDGKTAAFLQGRDFLAFGSLLNVIPEEDLYYINFGDPSVLRYFSKYQVNLYSRKIGVLVAAYKRYYGEEWYRNGTYINDLGYLLCGFPPSDFQKITAEVFREITVETLNKLGKCTTAQTRALFSVSTQREAYGPPYKWSSHEISRLGMLLRYMPEEDIPSIQLEAITAITAAVMKAMSQRKLGFFTKLQILRMNPKARRMYILRMQLKNSVTVNELVKQHV